jgi:hypothetical protein
LVRSIRRSGRLENSSTNEDGSGASPIVFGARSRRFATYHEDHTRDRTASAPTK